VRYERGESRLGGVKWLVLTAVDAISPRFAAKSVKATVKFHSHSANAQSVMAPAGCARRTESTGIGSAAQPCAAPFTIAPGPVPSNSAGRHRACCRRR